MQPQSIRNVDCGEKSHAKEVVTDFQLLKAQSRRLREEAQQLRLDYRQAVKTFRKTLARTVELMNLQSVAESRVVSSGQLIDCVTLNTAQEPAQLTAREEEVLRHIADGYSTKQVAATLGITYKTVACHRYRAMQKLGLHDTTGLVKYAIRRGVIRA